MKLILFVLFSLNLFSEEIDFIKSDLKEVKLYRNNGELYHEFDIKLKAGINDYYISNISDNIDINTIIAGIDNKASIYSVDYDASFSNKKKIDKLKDSLKIIQDKIPVISNDNYDIDLIEVSGGQKDFNGIITWKVNLEPNEQITKKLKFNVTHPGNVNIKK